MKVVGFNGSPRKYGNTARLLEAALAGARMAGAETVRVDLYDYEIRPCLGCLSDVEEACKLPCVIRDGMDVIYRLIEESDGLILATPIFWFNVSGVVKNLIDRMTAFENMIHHVGRSVVEGKAAGVIAVGNEQGGAMVTANLLLTLNSMGFAIPPWGFAYYTDKGDALEDEAAVLDSVNVGLAVAEAAKTSAKRPWYRNDVPLEEVVDEVRRRIRAFEEEQKGERGPLRTWWLSGERSGQA